MDTFGSKINGEVVVKPVTTRTILSHGGKLSIRFNKVHVNSPRNLAYLYFGGACVGTIDLNLIESCHISGDTFFLK